MSDRGAAPVAGPPPGPPGRPLPAPPPAPRRSAWWMSLAGVVVLIAAIAAVIAIAQAAGDDAPTGRDRPTVTTAPVPARTAPPAPSDGVPFADPAGSYTMTIGPDWADLSSPIGAGNEAWAVGPPTGSAANVNVLAHAAPDADLERYMAVSADELRAIDAELIDQAYVRGADGATLGSMRYAATPPGSAGPLEFLAVFDVRDGTAVVATLTGTADAFDELVGDVEPYLLTLRATG